MTDEDFRRLVLSMPEATEGSHMGHPDFRVKDKIFATLFWADDEDARARKGKARAGGGAGNAGSDGSDEIMWGMVKLTPEQQRRFVKTDPGVFMPVKGGWGRQGYTQVRLRGAKKALLPVIRKAVVAAWCNRAPKGLVGESGLGGAE